MILRVGPRVPQRVPQRVGQRVGFDDAAAFTPLLADLVEYWDLDEASGTRAGKHAGLDLTDNNTVTQADGVGAGQKAAQCTAANSEFLSRADDPLLDMGDIDFTIGCWARFDTAPGVSAGRSLLCKWNLSANQREYSLFRENDGTNDRIKFGVSSNGTAATFRAASTLGTPSENVWYFILGWHDSVANTINIQVDDGTVDSTSYSSGVHIGTSNLLLGSLPLASYFHDGRTQAAFLYKRVLTSAERTWLRNSGTAARLYADVEAYTG